MQSNDRLYDVLLLHIEFADIYTSTDLLLCRKSILSGIAINHNQNFSLNPENISVIQYSMCGTNFELN